MENQPSNDPGVHPQVLIGAHEEMSEGSSEDSSEDEPPMVEALEEQPTATTRKNGVSQPTNSANKSAKVPERTANNCPEGVAPNPKFLKKKERDPVFRAVNTQKSRHLEKQAAAVEQARRNADRKQINYLIEAIKVLANEQHVDNQKIESHVL